MGFERVNLEGTAFGRGAFIAALGLCLCMTVASAGGAGATLATGSPAAEPLVDSTFVQNVANGGGTFEQPLGVAFDVAQGEIVVANTGASRVEFFGLDGLPKGFFVHRVTDASGTDRDGLPKHVAVDARGRILVVDALASYIDVCDFRGTSLQRISLPAPDDDVTVGGGPGPIAVAPDGRIFVASRNKHGRIHVLDPDGKPLASWGEPGTEPGKLRAIAGLAVMPGGEIAVTCVLTQLGVQVFDAEGKYLRGFGAHDIGPGRFSVPNGIIVTPDGRIWVSDMMRHNVQVFDPAGNLLGVVGGGEGPGSMLYPSALASDGKGMFAFVETGGKLLRLMWIR
jgi:DNA-binding beta-propeller fold protein YncE